MISNDLAQFRRYDKEVSLDETRGVIAFMSYRQPGWTVK